MSHLDGLLQLINENVRQIQSAYAAGVRRFPTLDDPFALSPIDATLKQATALVVAAAAQLIATVQSPATTVMDAACGVSAAVSPVNPDSSLTFTSARRQMYLSSSIAVIEKLDIAEVLRDAGPNGLHIRDIGKQVGTNPDKLGKLPPFLSASITSYLHI